MIDGRVRLRHAFTTLALLAAAWAAILLLTGGIAFSVGPLHVSSRNARNPALAALLLLAGAAASAPAGARRRTLAADFRSAIAPLAPRLTTGSSALSRLRHIGSRPGVAPAAVALLIAFMLGASWTRGAYIAGGSDSFGYISEAHLFATGRLRLKVPLAHTFPHVTVQEMTPLGYRPAEDGSDTLVPTYAPGMPLTMAALERIAGMNAVYVVMPALAAIAVWCAYRLGVQLSGPGAGVGAALLLVTSPAFVFQLLGAPMSDLTAAGWWILALTLLLTNRRWTMAAAGVAAGMAILTRPNLLLVVVILGFYLLWQVWSTRERRSRAIVNLVLFSIPVVAACLTVAAFNAAWYGSPFRSGYSTDLFSLHFWSDNLRNYPRWLTESQTPLILLGLAAPFTVRWLRPGGGDRQAAVWMLAGVALTVFASYLFYMPFEAWWFLRFLLPAYPVLAVLTCVALAAVAARFGPVARVIAIALVIGGASVGYRYIKDENALGEYRYRLMAEWVRDHVPERSIVLAMQHSGSMQHYSGRQILRYDLVPPVEFDTVLDEIVAAGYHPYLVVDEWEVSTFQQSQRHSAQAALDWPATALLPLGNVRVWDLAEDREAARTSGRTPEFVSVPAFIRRYVH